MGGPILNGGPGTTAPPVGDGPALAANDASQDPNFCNQCQF